MPTSYAVVAERAVDRERIIGALATMAPAVCLGRESATTELIVLADPWRIEELRAARRESAILVVLPQARGAPGVARILDGGADGVIHGSLRGAELRARVRAILRRADRGVSTIRVGALELDRDAKRAWLSGVELALSPIELTLLAVLARHAGSVVTKGDLLVCGWGRSAPVLPTRALERHIARLRHRLGPRGPAVFTAWGVGYILLERR